MMFSICPLSHLVVTLPDWFFHPATLFSTTCSPEYPVRRSEGGGLWDGPIHRDYQVGLTIDL